MYGKYTVVRCEVCGRKTTVGDWVDPPGWALCTDVSGFITGLCPEHNRAETAQELQDCAALVEFNH